MTLPSIRIKSPRILVTFVVVLFAWIGLLSAFAYKAAANRAYVQSGPDGVFYARCIPRDNTGSAGSTDIYRVKSDGDELVDHYDWYSPHSVELGWSPIAGKVAVMVRHRDAPTTPDKQVELALHLGGKLLKTFTTDDLVRLGAEIHADPSGGGKRAEFQVAGCEQMERPNANQYAFTLRLSAGKLVFFNILTGNECIPPGRALGFKKDTAVVTAKPEESPLKSLRLLADDSPYTIAAAAKMGAETAAADIKAGIFRILEYGMRRPITEDTKDPQTGFRIQSVAGCKINETLRAEVDAYNKVMREWHAKNPTPLNK